MGKHPHPFIQDPGKPVSEIPISAKAARLTLAIVHQQARGSLGCSDGHQYRWNWCTLGALPGNVIV